MFTHCALEFFDHRGFETGKLFVRNGKTVRFQVRYISKADEMRDKPQAGLPALQLTEQHVIGLDVLRHCSQIANVARLPQDGSVAHHCNAIGSDLGEPFDDEIRQPGYWTIEFLL